VKLLKTEDIKKVLFVRLRFIGDVIISTAIIRDLKKRFPEMKLDYLAEKIPLKMLENNPDINNMIEAEKGNLFTFKNILKIRKKRYDAVIDVFGNPRSALLTFLSGAEYRIGWNIRGRAFCYNTFIERKDIIDPSLKSDSIDAYEDAVRMFGIEKSERETKLYLSESEKAFGEAFKKDHSLPESSNIIGIHPGCRRGESFTWPKEKYAELSDRLITSGNKVLLFGGPLDKVVNDEVVKAMKNKPVIVSTRSIREDLAVMSICDCFVTNNHGPVHMSAALNIPTVGIYRYDESYLWFPYKDPKFKVIDNNTGCEVCKSSDCASPKCMTEITGERVFNSVIELLDRKDKKNNKGGI